MAYWLVLALYLSSALAAEPSPQQGVRTPEAESKLFDLRTNVR